MPAATFRFHRICIPGPERGCETSKDLEIALPGEVRGFEVKDGDSDGFPSSLLASYLSSEFEPIGK